MISGIQLQNALQYQLQIYSCTIICKVSGYLSLFRMEVEGISSSINVTRGAPFMLIMLLRFVGVSFRVRHLQGENFGILYLDNFDIMNYGMVERSNYYFFVRTLPLVLIINFVQLYILS